jgi:hypothetical protein
MTEVQTEYGLAYLLTAAFVLLGMLLVCIPRPRKKDFEDPRKAGKKKRSKKA